MSDPELADRYRAYLRVLDERRFEDLADFVHDELEYNDEPMTRQQYADMIAGDVAAAPDLLFRVGTLVVDEDQVACRLLFDCTPVATFLGLTPTGARVVFSEHAFYRFRNGRIAAVRSLIDRAAVERQLAG
jgi:predicted ester cyclase